MSRKTTISMAVAAGLGRYSPAVPDGTSMLKGTWLGPDLDALERFADIVRVYTPTPAAVSIAEISVDELRRLMQKPQPIMPLLPMPAPPDVAAAVLAEREACAQLMADLREKSRNHLFRSALTVAEGEIRARGAA